MDAVTYRTAWEIVEVTTRAHGWDMPTRFIREAALVGTGMPKQQALDLMWRYLRDYAAEMAGMMQDGAGI